MANKVFTLLDLAARSGENVAAVVEDVTTVAPEFSVIPAIARGGVSYDILRRTGLPAGAFRKVGNGVDMGKSIWERETKPMFVFEAQMTIGEDIVKAQTSQSRATTGDILADEAIATVRGSIINIGAQAYYGIKADAEGFAGLATQSNTDISAGGTNGACTSAYLCWLDSTPINPQGVHFAVGLDGAFTFNEWARQQVTGADSKKTTAWVNNFMFYLGLAVGSPLSVFRITRIDAAHPLTDALAAQLVSKVPLARRNGLRWFMNRTAAYTLQAARATVNIATGGNKGVAGAGVFPDMPEMLAGYPITMTDSLLDTETNGSI